ncbi:MAG: ATP-dependent DNA ligase [Polyangiaceae bacterium]
MLLDEVVACSLDVAATRSRKVKIAAIAGCLAGMGPEEVEVGANFLAGIMRQGRIGLGYRTVSKVTAPAAAEPRLSLLEVDRRLGEIGDTSGKGSAKEKERLLGQLLGESTAREQDFLRRLLFGELRQGANEGVLIEGLAQASQVPSRQVRRAVMLAGALGEVARVALTEGREALRRFDVTLFRPVLPMLAQTSESPSEAVAKLERAIFDYKLDGARIQVHKRGDEVRVYTRALREVTPAVPEVAEALAAIPARELILDGEVLAVDAAGAPHAFQTTMRRFGRKLDVATQRKELPLLPYFFDCLYLDGQSLIDTSSLERAEALAATVASGNLIPRCVTGDADEAEAFLDAALAAGHEGLVAKAPDAAYAAGSRGAEWLKIKPAHTLDLVVLAAEWGSGRRRGWLSNIHLGARREDGTFCMLGKTFKGMTDEMLAWQTKTFREIAIGEEGHVVHLAPKLVVEIAVNDIQESPHYPGGLALRFARVKRYRPDKRPEDADTLATVLRLHEQGARSKRR